MERVEREAILWLVEKMIEDIDAELAVHHHAHYLTKARAERRKFAAVARYYHGELWLEDREEKLKLLAALTSGDTTQEEVKEIADGADGSVDADIHPDDSDSTGDVEDDKEPGITS